MKLNLTNQEVKLLLSILEESVDNRADMTCNDAYSREKKLFKKEERIKIMKKYLVDELSKEDLEDLDGDMANFDYVTFLINKIKEQIK